MKYHWFTIYAKKPSDKCVLCGKGVKNPIHFRRKNQEDTHSHNKSIKKTLAASQAIRFGVKTNL